MFLSVLADGLSPADEPLLETALNDRAADVHGWVAHLEPGCPGPLSGSAWPGAPSAACAWPGA